MNRGWSEDRLGFQNEGLFCTGAASVTVAAASQWPRQQEKGRARLPRACVQLPGTHLQLPKWRPPPVSTFPALSRTFWQPGKCAHPCTSVRVKALPRDPFPPVHGPGLCSIYIGKHNIKGKQAKRRERKRKRTQAATSIASANPGNIYPHSSRGTIHLQHFS